MSLATETSTAEEKTVYSVCGLLQFRAAHRFRAILVTRIRTKTF